MKKRYITICFLLFICTSGFSQNDYWGLGTYFMVPIGDKDAYPIPYDLGFSIKGSYLIDFDSKFYAGASIGANWHSLLWSGGSENQEDFYVYPVSGKFIYPVSESIMILGEGGYGIGGKNFDGGATYLNPGIGYQNESGLFGEVTFTNYLKNGESMKAITVGGTYYFSF